MRNRARTIIQRLLSRKSFALFARVSFVSVMLASFPAVAEEGVGGALQGVAKIIEAASPIGEAAARAQADKQIAQINADASVAITQIGANTSLYLADVQASVALYQSMTASLINQYNQQGVTDRLVLQLNELRAARQDAYQAEREKLALQREFQMAQIQLAYKQAADSLTLAREQMKLQLTTAGLSQGFSNSRNSGSGLTVTRLDVGNTSPATTISSAGGLQTASASRGASDETSKEEKKSELLTANVVDGKPKYVQRQAAIQAGRGRSATSSRLLASVGAPRITFSNAPKAPPVALAAAKSTPFVTASAARGSTSSVRLRLDIGKPDSTVVASRAEPSDLRGFMRAFRPAPSEGEPHRSRGFRGPAASSPGVGSHGADAVGQSATSVGSGHRGQ